MKKTTFFTQVRSMNIQTKKICKDCTHFIGNTSLECGKFGDTDIITGRVMYPYARTMREKKEKCGEDAIHFEENPYKMITEPYYFCRDTCMIMLPTAFFTVFFITLLKNMR
jgi:hypothetical protein